MKKEDTGGGRGQDDEGERFEVKPIVCCESKAVPRASGLPPALLGRWPTVQRFFPGRGAPFLGRRAAAPPLLVTVGLGGGLRVLRAGGGGCQGLLWTLGHHVGDALAVVAFLWLGGQAALLGVVIKTSTVVTPGGKAQRHGSDTTTH